MIRLPAATLSIFFAIAFGDPRSGVARQFYFAASGQDDNNCESREAPCRSIEKANAVIYAPGDSIRFRGGDTFYGCLAISRHNVPSGGISSNPITFESYGGGSAALFSNCPGQRALMTIDSISGLTIQNLILSGNGTRTAMGILVQNSNPASGLGTVIIRKNDISGFMVAERSQYSSEVFIGGYASNGRCGALHNIQVIDNKLHGAAGPTSLDDNGITGYGCGQNITDVKYSGNEVYDIGGHAQAPGGTSGNGIVAANVRGGEESFNLVHDNGANTTTCGGPAGVWAFRSSRVTISSNEVYNMRPLPSYPGGGACDWAAYDLDAGVTDSLVEYNYSHNNAGPGLLAYTAEEWGPNTFRYNISVNDGIILGGGSIAVGSGGVSQIYNNTLYRSGTYPGEIAPSCIFFGYSGVFKRATLVANNLCVNSMTDRLGRTAYLDATTGVDVSPVIVRNNLYYDPHGRGFWRWLNAEYPSLAAFRSATGADKDSIVAQPLLDDPGHGRPCAWAPQTANGPQPCPAAYRLKNGSVAIGAGANLALAPYGLDVGTRDYFGHALHHGIGSGYNIGADGFAPR